MPADSPKSKTEKVCDKIVCESCGKEFTCDAKTGKCWCFEVELNPKTFTELREKFKSCLCGDCLKIIEGSK